VRGGLGHLLRAAKSPGTISFWEARYRSGGDSGLGSFGRLAQFKADVLNEFVRQAGIASIIEFGCGDGNQLRLAAYPSYVGLDVSREAIRICAENFRGDPTRSFFLYDPTCFVDNARCFQADLALSLDVVYHLVETEQFHLHMAHLFQAARRFVVVYSTDHEKQSGVAGHVRHRRFTDYVSTNFSEWALVRKIDNACADEPCFDSPDLVPDFYVFGRKDGNPNAGCA